MKKPEGRSEGKTTTRSGGVQFGLARKLLAAKQDLARAVTDDLFARPGWAVSHQDPGRESCAADVCFQLESLAGAIEAGSPEAFGDYSHWMVRMLGARGIAGPTPEENFARLREYTDKMLLPLEREALSSFLARSRVTGSAWRREASPPDREPAFAGGLVWREANKLAVHKRAEDIPVDGLDRTGQAFLAAILSGRRKVAIDVVEQALRDGASHVDIYLRVFTEALHRVGELWEQNRISVGQEHVATAIVQYALAVIYTSLVPAPVQRGTMVVTGVAGEMHQIGANLVADAMEEEGWNVRFLGTNLPNSSVVAAVRESAADTLCISTTLLANLPSAAELVRAVRAEVGEQVPRIVLGGAACRFATGFAREIGAAESFTDLRPALAALCPPVGNPAASVRPGRPPSTDNDQMDETGVPEAQHR